MLVLSRKVGEQIKIGPNVVFTVVEIRGDRVRLGFEAPGNVAIHREEIYCRIKGLEEEQPPRCAPRESRYHSEFA